eukprot:Nk52_evm7s251 gene=Nk52_evmTU7s251
MSNDDITTVYNPTLKMLKRAMVRFSEDRVVKAEHTVCPPGSNVRPLYIMQALFTFRVMGYIMIECTTFCLWMQSVKGKVTLKWSLSLCISRRKYVNRQNMKPHLLSWIAALIHPNIGAEVYVTLFGTRDCGDASEFRTKEIVREMK